MQREGPIDAGDEVLSDIGVWRNVLTDDEQQRFGSVAKELLSDPGYAR